MKIKEIEKMTEKKVKSIMSDLSTLITLYELYENEASSKRKARFEKKLCKKYGKAFEKLEDRVDNLDIF